MANSLYAYPSEVKFRMDKKIIKEQLLKELKDLEQSTKTSLNNTTELKNSEDMKQEGKYDTRRIEVGYLEQAQSKRLNEIQQEIELVEQMSIKTMPVVSIGSAIKLSVNNHTQWYFITPLTGGKLMQVNNQAVALISAFSPIASAAIGLQVHDEFDVEVNNQTREYKILDLK